MKDAKMETTVIPAKDKRSNKPHLRVRNTDLENEIYRLKSELSRARLVVLEELEKKIESRLNRNKILSDSFNNGNWFAKVTEDQYILLTIHAMKEATK